MQTSEFKFFEFIKILRKYFIFPDRDYVKHPHHFEKNKQKNGKNNTASRKNQPTLLQNALSIFVDWKKAKDDGQDNVLEEKLYKVNDSSIASRILNGHEPLTQTLSDLLIQYFDDYTFIDEFDNLIAEGNIDDLVSEINKHKFSCNADTVRYWIPNIYKAFLNQAKTRKIPKAERCIINPKQVPSPTQIKSPQKKDVVEPSSESTPTNMYSSNLFDYNYDFMNAVKEYGASLILECNRICPNDNCTNSLLYEKNGRAVPNYEIVRIDPTGKLVFKNLIALCPECAKKYKISYDDQISSTQIRMDRMKEIKEELSSEVMNTNLLNPVREIDIRAVMLAINNKLNKATPILNYDPVKVEQKIEPQNGLLLYQIKMLVSGYYLLVRDTLKKLSDENALTFDLGDFARTVRKQYEILVNKKLTQPQVFEWLVSWLKNLSKSDDTACRVIIAYFVQNCEVFDALPQ